MQSSVVADESHSEETTTALGNLEYINQSRRVRAIWWPRSALPTVANISEPLSVLNLPDGGPLVTDVPIISISAVYVHVYT